MSADRTERVVVCSPLTAGGEAKGKGIAAMTARDDEPRATAHAQIETELYCAFAGFVLGLFAILVGLVMFYLGISGKEPWVARALGHSNELVDALPGAVLSVAGLLVIRATRRKG